MMRSLFSRIALVAAILCAALWTLKAIAISIAGGLDRSPAEEPLFLAGFLACVVAAVAVSVTVGIGRRAVWARIVAGVLTLVGLIAVPLLIQPLADAAAAMSPSWIWGEVNLWVASAVVLTVSIILYRHAAHSRHHTPLVADARSDRGVDSAPGSTLPS